MIPKKVIQLMEETAEQHLEDVVNGIEPSLDAIDYEFPVYVPFEEKFYKTVYVSSILANQFIFAMDEEELCEIDMNEYLDTINSVKDYPYQASFGCN